MEQRTRWFIFGCIVGFMASDALIHLSLILRVHGVL